MTVLKSPSCKTCGSQLVIGMCPQCVFTDVLTVVEGGGTLPREAEPLLPRQFGSYDLIEEIGGGAMGVVWKARHRELDRVVAMKLVRGGCLPGEKLAGRFRREAGAAAKLRHPNIVTIHEVGEFDEQLFLTMDLVEGGSLADWLRRVAFSPSDAAVMIAKVARGVHHAHEMGILHRDIKPGNILLDPNGEPLVCDFGLAKFMTEESDLTLSAEMLGTPAYLSPEQASGPMSDLTAASDTYSLGAVLYELLCGQPPFIANNFPALLRKVVEDDPMRPISHFSGSRIPFELSTICLKCLEKEPKARYETTLALAEDLERWVRGEPIVARPVARVEQMWKWMRRKPVLAALWVGVTVLLVVVALVATILGLRVERQREIAEEQADRSRERLARQLSHSAQYLIEQSDWLRALPALAEAIELGTGDARLDEVNRIRFGTLLRMAPNLEQAWFSHEPIFRAEANRAGTRLMLATRKSVEVWDTQKGARIGVPFVPEDGINGAAFDSAHGEWAVIESGSGRCAVWKPGSGEVSEIGTGRVDGVPDAYLHRENMFVLVDGDAWSVYSAKDSRCVAGPYQNKASIEWATPLPGLKRVIGVDAEGMLHLWDMHTGEDAVPPLHLGEKGKSVRLDGFNSYTEVAALHRARESWLIHCVSGEVIARREGHSDIPQSFGWDAQGRWMYLARSDEGVSVRELESDALRWKAAHGGLGFRGSFSTDSQLLATQSWIGTARVWTTNSGSPVTPYLWQMATPGSCLLSQDGSWLLTRGDEPAARFWRLRENSGAEVLSTVIEKPVSAFFAGVPESLTVAERSGRVSTWSAAAPFKKISEIQHPEALIVAAPVAGGSRVFTAGGGSAIVWDRVTGEAVGERFDSDKQIIAASVAPDGDAFAVALRDGGVVVWDVAKGVVRARLDVSAKQVSFANTGGLLLVIGDTWAQTWHTATEKPVSPRIEQPGEKVAAVFSPDGQRVAQWSDSGKPGASRARIWDAVTGRTIAELSPHWLGVRAVAWSPDGRRIATGGGDHAVQISDGETGELVVPPMRHFQKIGSLGFSSDGLLIWALVDHEVIVRDALSGEMVIPRMPSLRHTSTVASSADGNHLVTIGDKAAPMVWDLSPEMREPEELRGLAHVLSAHRLVDGTSALAPLTLSDLRGQWARARELLGAWPEVATGSGAKR